MNFIHASMHSCILTTLHHLSKNWISPMLSIQAMFTNTSKSNFGFSFRTTTLSLGMIKSSLLHRDPFHRNGYRFLGPLLRIGRIFCQIETLSSWMVKFILSHRDPLRENGHRFLGLLLRIGQIVWRIETLYLVMVTESFQI